MAPSENWLRTWWLIDLFEQFAKRLPGGEEKATLIDGLMVLRLSMVSMLDENEVTLIQEPPEIRRLLASNRAR